MKTPFRIVLFGIIAMMLAQPANGQRFLKKLQEKVQEKVEEKVDEKAEEKIDDTMDNQLDKMEESTEGEDSETRNAIKTKRDNQREERMGNLLKGLGISGEPVPVADSYSFSHLIEMHLESYDINGKKESEGEFITHLDPGTKSMAYEIISGDMGQPGQGLFIIDAENGATIILSEENGEKTGVVYGMGAFFSSLGQTYEEENDEVFETPEAYLTNPNITKTGRSKTIAGYKCEEYKHTDDESESEIWITTNLKMNTQDFFSTLFKTSLYSHGMPWGYMMEATTTEKESGEKTFMQVKRVDEKSNVRFSLNEYQVTNLGSFTMPQGEE